MKTKINQVAYELGSVRSHIREIFEYSKKRANEIGTENIFDFSIGNPSVQPPKEVRAIIAELNSSENQTSLHGYTSASGDISVRRSIAQNLNETAKAKLSEENIYMTCGAAASLCISLKAIISDTNDEIIVLKPYFPEYSVFIQNMGGKMIAVESEKDTFRINFGNLEKAINKNTKAIIINSPNNPCGVMYSDSELSVLGKLIDNKSVEFDSPIYLISDEPYREIVYDSMITPNIFNYYANVIMCYSYSKALSLAGERIGYIAISPQMFDSKNVYFSVCGAGRMLGYVCAPSMFQQLVARLGNKTVDVGIYQRNRDILLEQLTNFGFSMVKPQGAFYLFLRAEQGTAAEFCEIAKKFELMFVPSESFGVTGYVRIAFCKQEEEIKNALPAFKKLAEYLGLKGRR